MRVLSRHLLVRFAATFGAVMAVLVLAVAVVELVGDFDDVVSSSEGLGGALLYVALRVPAYYLPLLIPAATFIAAFVSIGTAARAHEIVAIKAGGISPLRVTLPVLVAGAIIAGIGLLTNETLSIRAHEAWQRHRRGGDLVAFRRGSFWYHKGHYVYNVRDADPQARSLRDVAVFELDPRGRLVRSIRAAQAQIAADGHWVLDNAVIRKFEPDDPRAPATYEEVARAEIALSEELALLDADVHELSIRDLQEYLEGRPRSDPEAVRAEALLNERLVSPLSAFVFALLGIPLGLRVEQTRSMAVPALQGVAALFLFSTAREYANTLATQGVTPPAATAWGVLAFFALLGAWQLSRVPR